LTGFVGNMSLSMLYVPKLAQLRCPLKNALCAVKLDSSLRLPIKVPVTVFIHFSTQGISHPGTHYLQSRDISVSATAVLTFVKRLSRFHSVRRPDFVSLPFAGITNSTPHVHYLFIVFIHVPPHRAACQRLR